jgi:3D (Asp-Asp-Asp) domain-containing protein
MLSEALFLLTAYSLTCDAPGPHTKAGIPPVPEWTIAADPKVLPIGSVVEIEGLGRRIVHDIGGKVRGRHIDVYLESCQGPNGAKRWKNRLAAVRVLHIGGTRVWSE